MTTNKKIQHNILYSISWIDLAVLSIALSGLFSILIVAMRTPVLHNLFESKDFFSHALASHVNLSVLFWMLCIGASTWHSNNLNKAGKYISFFAIISLIFFTFTQAKSYLNNYIPIIDTQYYIFSIFLFIVTIGAYAFYYSIKSCGHSNFIYILSCFTILLSSIVSIYDVAAYLSKTMNSANWTRHEYYENLMWGSGHILQYLYITVYAHILFHLSGINSKKFPNMIYAFNAVVCIYMALMQVFSHNFYDNYIAFYTDNMRHIGGISIFVAYVYFFTQFLDQKIKLHRNVKLGIFLSFIMFCYGGILGFLIQGMNVVVPAHYHGSIVGITILFMTYVYDKKINTRSNYNDINQKMLKQCNIQMIIYFIGQLIHITALSISGGYGALRKAPGEVASHIKLYMGLMGLGGLIAVIGGIMFVVLYYKIKFRGIVSSNTISHS